MAMPTETLPVWSSEHYAQACTRPLHKEALHGIHLFNSGLYFEAHEALETAWRAEKDPRRELYRAILLAGVALLHFKRGNYHGSLKVCQRSLRWLNQLPQKCSGVCLVQLTFEMQQLESSLQAIAPTQLSTLPFPVISPIIYQPDITDANLQASPTKEF